ncbi:Poly(RC)-binding protein 3, partial [Durusdinium trenchii]
FEAFDLPRWPSASMNASDIPCRVLLSQWQVKQVLGDKGEENLKRLRMTSGANVQLLRGPLLPAAFRARDEFLAVLWADDGVRLRRALNGLLERAYAKRQVGNLRKEDEPDSHVLEVMIPEVACRHLIGARGDRIKLLREESRCEIHMSPGNVAGIAAQRRVKCNGLVPSLAEAVARIHEVLVEFAEIGILSLRHFDLQEVSTGVQETNEGHVTSRFLGPGLAGISRREARNARIAVRQLVSAEECGWLIGKRGNKIHKLRELALVSTREADAEVCNGGPRSVVEIFGAPIAKCICVLQLIVDDLELFPEVQPCTSLLVPASLAPFLTGLDEAASKGCDARVLAGGNWFLLELRGTAQQRLLGAQAAHEAVEAAAAER